MAALPFPPVWRPWPGRTRTRGHTLGRWASPWLVAAPPAARRRLLGQGTAPCFPAEEPCRRETAASSAWPPSSGRAAASNRGRRLQRQHRWRRPLYAALHFHQSPHSWPFPSTTSSPSLLPSLPWLTRRWTAHAAPPWAVSSGPPTCSAPPCGGSPQPHSPGPPPSPGPWRWLWALQAWHVTRGGQPPGGPEWQTRRRRTRLVAQLRRT